MAQSQRLVLRPGLRPALSARARTGLEMLARPAADLRGDLERLAVENPFLVLAPDERRRAQGEAGEAAVRAVAEPETLARHVERQLALMRLPGPVAALAAYFAADLDARGFLAEPDEELARETGATVAQVAAARRALQACDPAGIGARDLGDCIRLQLIDAGTPEDEAAAIHRQLRPLAAGRFAEAAAELGISAGAAEALAGRIARLSPDPASSFSPEPLAALQPELAVRVGADGRLAVSLLDDPGAGLGVDEGLAARAHGSGDAAARDFVTAQRAAARAVVAAVAFRARTLLRVGHAIAEGQSAYFLGAARAPAPLPRAEIAARLGLHPSTVGRAVRGRGLLFAGRVRPLAWYLPPASAQAGPETLSAADVQARMRDMLSRETPETVMSDEEIAEKLREDGVDIARRTVAKYRGCLSIPSSSQRRRRLARAGRTRRA